MINSNLIFFIQINNIIFTTSGLSKHAQTTLYKTTNDNFSLHPFVLLIHILILFLVILFFSFYPLCFLFKNENNKRVYACDTVR